MDKEEFTKETIKSFDFLTKKFNFRIKSQKSDNQIYRVIYQNETTAVKVFFEEREQWIFVDLYRLINGKIKENPIIICNDGELNEFDLQNILIIRDFAKRRIFRNLYSNKKKNFKKILQLLSKALKENAQDVLKGDFSIFPELEKIVKSRIKPRKNVSKKEKQLIATFNKE